MEITTLILPVSILMLRNIFIAPSYVISWAASIGPFY